MDTKERMLELFEHHRGIYFSGEMIAEKLNVSRTAVWKAVKNLQKEGYRIDAVRNKGYCLSEETDILSEQGIGKYLKPVCEEIQIHVEESVEYACEKAGGAWRSRRIHSDRKSTDIRSWTSGKIILFPGRYRNLFKHFVETKTIYSSAGSSVNDNCSCSSM